MIIKRISEDTGLKPEYIIKVASSASYRYKSFSIKKRKGGDREVSQPTKEVKLLQRWIVDNVIINLPVHESVYSYRKDISIKHLAIKHKRYNFLMRVDFKDFFPSITYKDIISLLKKNEEVLPWSLTDKDIMIINYIVCRFGKLTIGASSSPAITNAMLFEFDSHWDKRAKRNSSIYSRYADDLFFSSNRPNVLYKIYEELENYLRYIRSPKLTLNRDKTVFTSKKKKRIVTGLVLTSEDKVSIGRQKKRYIKSLIYKYINDDLNSEQLSFLRGYLAYIKNVEPKFLTALRKKYTIKVINDIFKSELVPRKNTLKVFTLKDLKRFKDKKS